MSATNFRTLITFVQFFFSILLAIFVYRQLYLPRKRNRTGKYLNFKYKLPKKYFRLPVERKYLEGSFAKLPLKDTKSSITIVSKNILAKNEERRKELLKPKDNSYSIKTLDEGWKTVQGKKWHWIKTHHIGVSKDITIISYLLEGNNCFIEIGCGATTDSFEQYEKDYDDLLQSIRIDK